MSTRVIARSHTMERFTVRTGNRITFVLANEIDWIGAVGDYANLHIGNKSFLFRETIDGSGDAFISEEICSHPSLGNRASLAHLRTPYASQSRAASHINHRHGIKSPPHLSRSVGSVVV